MKTLFKLLKYEKMTESQRDSLKKKIYNLTLKAFTTGRVDAKPPSTGWAEKHTKDVFKFIDSIGSEPNDELKTK